ncbi:MAG: hypothetical protein ACRCXG_16200 [Vibrio sp.]
MAEPRTEVILAPKVDRADLQRVKESMDSAFEDVAAKNKKEIEKATEKGVSKGMKDGGEEGLSFLKKGLIGIAAAVGAAAMNAAMGADEVVSRMEARLSTIRDVSKEAAAFGVSSGEYAQLNAVFESLGYDQSDVRGILAGFQAEFDKPEMEKFKNITDQNGLIQSLMAFIASTSGMSQTERSARLAPLGDEDAVITSAIAAKIAESGATNMQQFFEAMTGTRYTASQLEKYMARGELESSKLSQYNAQKYLEDIAKGGNADQIKQSMELDRRLEGAHDRNIGTKLTMKELTVNAEIASLNAVNATITGLENIFKDLDETLEGRRTERTRELTQKIESGEVTAPEFVESVVRQTMLSFVGLFDKYFGEDTKSDSNQQDYTK